MSDLHVADFFSEERTRRGDRFKTNVGVCANMWQVCREVGGVWRQCRWEEGCVQKLFLIV